MPGRALAIVIAAILATTRVAAAESTLLDRLAADDRAVVDTAVAELETRPSDDPDTLFAAARASEDVLLDPARALRLYERVLAVAPASRIALAAGRRADRLRAQVGTNAAYAGPARELASLIARADTLPQREVEAAARTLADTAWPGAPDAALWLAEWQRRSARFDIAEQAYASVMTRWPNSPQARAARRGQANLALDVRDWDRAVTLATRLPIIEPLDALERDDILVLAARGARFDHLYIASWIAVALGLALLLGSLADAVYRGGRRWPRVPTELVFLAPVTAVLVGVSFTTHHTIAPAVTIIATGGLVFAGLSGATLDLLRVRARPVRLRATAHAAVCVIAIVALVYVAVMRESLLEMLIETVRFGPEGG